MAGGMNKRGAWGPMTERLAQSHRETPPSPSVRHCWVNGRDGRVAALLLEWRQADVGCWLGRVVRPVLDSGAWVVVEEWVAGELLEPVREASPAAEGRKAVPVTDGNGL